MILQRSSEEIYRALNDYRPPVQPQTVYVDRPVYVQPPQTVYTYAPAPSYSYGYSYYPSYSHCTSRYYSSYSCYRPSLGVYYSWGSRRHCGSRWSIGIGW